MTRFVSRFAAILLLANAMLVGSQAAHAAPDEVTFLLPAPATLPAFAPWMLAQHNGYYAAENLKVNFVVGRGGVDVAKQVGAGNAVIGVAPGDAPMILRANGVMVKTVAMFGAGSLMMIAVHDDGTVNRVQDLKGKSASVIAYTDGTYYALLASLRQAGLTKQDVNIEAAGPAGVWQQFAARRVQAMAAVPDWVVITEQSGVKVKLLPVGETFQGLAQTMVASDEAIRTQPQLLRRLVRASLRGMQDIMQDPKRAASAYVLAVPSFKGKQDQIEKMFALYKQYVYADQSVLGQVDPKRLDTVQKFYVSENIIPAAWPLDDLYTNVFVVTAR